MADDLDAFFKKQAKKPKKGAVLSVGNLEKKLLNAVKRQEEIDKEEEQTQKNIEIANIASEDSEWHEFQDDQASVDIARIGIKEMELNEGEDVMEAVSEEEFQQNKKTWHQADENEKPGEDEQLTPVPDPTIATEKPKLPSKYVPPTRRLGGGEGGGGWRGRGQAAPEIQNQEEFPSLANADEIAAKHENDRKRMESMKPTATPSTTATVWGSKKQVIGQDVTAASKSNPFAGESKPEDKYKVSGGGYIPPHLRNRS